MALLAPLRADTRHLLQARVPFEAELSLDEDGLVVDYPSLFERI